MGGYKDRDLQEDHGVNGTVEGGKSSGRPRHRLVDAKRKSSGRPRHKWEGRRREIFRNTKA